jgi:heat shock protein HslJ
MIRIKQMTTIIVALALMTQLAMCDAGEPVEPPDTSIRTQAEKLYRAVMGTPPAQPGITLEGTEWVLLHLRGNQLVPGSYITLSFAGGEISGFGGCNRYRGLYETTDGALTFPEITRTAMACPWLEGSTEQEAAYIRALTNATFFQAEEEALVIRGANGQALGFAPRKRQVINPDELLGTAWQLVWMDSQRTVEGSRPILSFHDHHRAAGHTGCRDYVASYRTTGGYFGYFATDMVGADCPEGELLAQQEAAYTALLRAARDYRLLGDRLEITTRQQEVLVYEPLPASPNAALEGTVWTLRTFVQLDTLGQRGPNRYWMVDLLPEAESTLTFEQGTAKGSAGCNTYQAVYGDEGDLLSFRSLTFSEKKYEDPIMQQEAQYLDVLQDVTTYRINGSQLWLDAENGWALAFGTGN